MERERNQWKNHSTADFPPEQQCQHCAIQETKLTSKTKPLKTPGCAAVRLDRHKIKGGGLLMIIKDIIHFVVNTAAHPQSSDPNMEQQGYSITMPNRQ